MQLNPYLSFDGQCEAAFKFYERCLSGKITMLETYGNTPMAKEMPPEVHKKIIHARLVAGDKVLMGSDACCGRYEKSQGFHVTIGVDSAVEAERVFKALSENGTITMPLQETFWATRFGMLVDSFGIPWMINCEKTA